MRLLKIVLGLSVVTLSCVAEPGDTAEVDYVESSDDCVTIDAGIPNISLDDPAMLACRDAGSD